MISLSQLLERAGVEPVATLAADPAIDFVVDDSRKAAPGALFVAVRGTEIDSHRFLEQTAHLGAHAAVVEPDYDGPSEWQTASGTLALPLVRVRNTRRALGLLVHAALEFPAHDMRVFGVTGTNGKSSVAYLIEGIFKASGLRPGLFSTIHIRYPGVSFPSTHTTPGSVSLAGYLDEMRRHQVDSIAMEVSSHAVEQHRVAGMTFDCGIFTNLTGDHLDYHGDMETYAGVKRKFFANYVAGERVLNIDDPYGARWAAEFGGDRVTTYGEAPEADVRLIRGEATMAGTVVEIAHQDQTLTIQSPMRGAFNVQNLTAAAAAGLAMGFHRDTVIGGLESVEGVPGRFQTVDAGQPFDVVVDYAHTPDALRRVLSQARELARGRLVLVFGCGGDRDTTKREPMGRAAGEFADWIVVTNDNPRFEDPERIARQILEGVMAAVSKSADVDMILDRRQAILTAVEEARDDDLILIAGKGHERYELVRNQLFPCDDRETAREAIQLHKDRR